MKNLLKTLLRRTGKNRDNRNFMAVSLSPSSLPMISCGLAQRNRQKIIFCRRENHGVVGRRRDQVLVSLGAASRKRAARSTLTKVEEATAEVRPTNWTPAAWQYNYGPCSGACVHIRASVRYACNVTTEHAIAGPIRYRRYEGTKRRALAISRNSF